MKIDLDEKLSVHKNFDVLVFYFGEKKKQGNREEKAKINVILQNLVAAKMCFTALD